MYVIFFMKEITVISFVASYCFVAKKPKDAIAGLRSAVLSRANTFIYSFITVSIFIFKRLFAYS